MRSSTHATWLLAVASSRRAALIFCRRTLMSDSLVCRGVGTSHEEDLSLTQIRLLSAVQPCYPERVSVAERPPITRARIRAGCESPVGRGGRRCVFELIRSPNNPYPVLCFSLLECGLLYLDFLVEQSNLLIPAQKLSSQHVSFAQHLRGDTSSAWRKACVTNLLAAAVNGRSLPHEKNISKRSKAKSLQPYSQVYRREARNLRVQNARPVLRRKRHRARYSSSQQAKIKDR